MNFFRSSLVITIALAVIIGAGCGEAANTAQSNTGANASTANANTHAGHVANTSAGDSTAAVPAPGSPTAVYKEAYKARKDKDAAALKKLMSKELLEFLTDMGQLGDEKKSLDEILVDGGKQLTSDETRNEKIDGDRATLEYRAEGDEWEVMDFVKEDGTWKMALPAGDDKAEIESEPKAKKK